MTCLPPHLENAKHWDYPWPLSYIPRRWTTFCFGVPKIIAGNQKEIRENAKSHVAGPAPIGEKASFQISRFPDAPGLLKYIPLYVSFTLKNGWHFRAGARWDDVDNYVTFPSLAIRKYSGEKVEDTSTN